MIGDMMVSKVSVPAFLRLTAFEGEIHELVNAKKSIGKKDKYYNTMTGILTRWEEQEKKMD